MLFTLVLLLASLGDTPASTCTGKHSYHVLPNLGPPALSFVCSDVFQNTIPVSVSHELDGRSRPDTVITTNGRKKCKSEHEIIEAKLT